MPLLSSDYLLKLVAHMFLAVGAPESTAMLVADSLVQANLEGHDSHGVIRVVEYLDKISIGKINPAAEPEMVKETSTTVSVDGHWGFGQLTASWAMDKVIQKALDHSIAAGALFNCGHIGLCGAYPQMAALNGLIGLAFANGGGTKPRVAPFGGARPTFFANPIAAAWPAKGRSPIVMDFSTSVVASGKIRVLRDKGEQMPEGWVLDKEGKPTREPKDYYDGGMLLPAAGHKGFALSLLVEVLGGLLTGAGTVILPASGYQVGNGVFLMAIDVEAFLPPDQFEAQIDQLVRAVKDTPPLEKGGEVLMPGEPEQRTKRIRRAEGIPVPEKTWQAIAQAAGRLGIDL